MSTSSGARMTLLAAEDSPSSGIILLPSVSPEDTSLNPPSPSWRQVRPASGRSREYFSGLNFKIISVNQYLGAWVWEFEGGGAWIQVRVESWVNSNHHLDNVAAACHQTAYTGFQQTLQQECQFMKYTTGVQGVGGGYIAPETSIAGYILSAFFRDLGTPPHPTPSNYSASFLVKKSELDNYQTN